VEANLNQLEQMEQSETNRTQFKTIKKQLIQTNGMTQMKLIETKPSKTN
jgi:hypothetical protein